MTVVSKHFVFIDFEVVHHTPMVKTLLSNNSHLRLKSCLQKWLHIHSYPPIETKSLGYDHSVIKFHTFET